MISTTAQIFALLFVFTIITLVIIATVNLPDFSFKLFLSGEIDTYQEWYFRRKRDGDKGRFDAYEMSRLLDIERDLLTAKDKSSVIHDPDHRMTEKESLKAQKEQLEICLFGSTKGTARYATFWKNDPLI